MNTPSDFDRRASAWLAEGPTEFADRVLDAALREVHLTHQRRRWSTPWRFPNMPALTRATAVAAVALVAVAAAGGALYITSVDSGPVPSPTPSPKATEQPLPTMSTDGWRPYYAARQGFTISYPADGWTLTPASREWDMTSDRKGPPPRSDGAENFYNADLAVGSECCGLLISAFKVYFEGYTTEDEFVDAYLPLAERQACDRVDDAESLVANNGTMHALLIQLCDDVQAFVFGRNDVYVIAGWRRDSADWVRAFLSTFHEGPPDVSLWTPFTSSRYGYSLAVPLGWETTTASRDWQFDLDRADWVAVSQDFFVDKEAQYQVGLFGFAADVPSATSAEDWIDAFYDGNPDFSACPVIPADLVATTIDGVEGRVAEQDACSDEVAFVLLNRRMYVFKVGRDGQERLFERFLSTVRLP